MTRKRDRGEDDDQGRSAKPTKSFEPTIMDQLRPNFVRSGDIPPGAIRILVDHIARLPSSSHVWKFVKKYEKNGFMNSVLIVKLISEVKRTQSHTTTHNTQHTTQQDSTQHNTSQDKVRADALRAATAIAKEIYAGPTVFQPECPADVPQMVAAVDGIHRFFAWCIMHSRALKGEADDDAWGDDSKVPIKIYNEFTDIDMLKTCSLVRNPNPLVTFRSSTHVCTHTVCPDPRRRGDAEQDAQLPRLPDVHHFLLDVPGEAGTQQGE